MLYVRLSNVSIQIDRYENAEVSENTHFLCKQPVYNKLAQPAMTCLKLIIETLERRRCSGIFIVNFEHISHLVLVFLLLTLSRQMPAGSAQATFRDESSSASNNIKFQIFQKYFQNVQPFSVNKIKCLNIYADS